MRTRMSLRSVFCMVVFVCAVGVAQGQQRRGLSLPSVLTAATVPAVAKQLELSDEQSALAKKLDGEARQLRQEMLEGLGDLSQEERRESFAKYGERLREKEQQLGESVGEKKSKRLRQLSVQAGGLLPAFFDRETAAKLDISEDQRREGMESLRGLRDEFVAAGDDFGARNELLKKASNKLAEFLTTDQTSKWTEMLGKPASEALLSEIRSAAAQRR